MNRLLGYLSPNLPVSTSSGRSVFRLAIIVLAFVLLLLGGSPAIAAKDAVTEQALKEITQQWETSAHALNDVNCTSCHQNEETKAFVANPDHESCLSCHEQPVETFLLGKHGIRTLEGESPLTPAMAHIPMKQDAFDKQMSCNACHNVHTVNTMQAAVDSCLTCHNDTHSLNYENSKHGKAVLAASLPRPGDGQVTCATCHLPRSASKNAEGTAVAQVNHNNTYTLKPRNRMVGEVCMNCHGVEYSYNSIFDDDLVEANFDRPPTLEHESFELMRVAEQRRTGNTTAPAESSE
ncbi:MAG: cytochrome c3 family protein [Cyanobacteria bacterium J06634_6]